MNSPPVPGLLASQVSALDSGNASESLASESLASGPLVSGTPFISGHLESKGALVQGILTCALFLFGFAVPVLAGLQVGGVVSIWDGGLWSKSSGETERLFPSAFQVASQGSHLRIKHQAEINPQADQEFVLTAWFNLRRMPLPGEKLILLSKYEGSGKAANGYAIGLSRDETSLRPVVYWGGSEQGGRWYDFPEVNLTPRTWFMLALSFTGGRFIGLYQGEKPQGEGTVGEGTLQLLGGYELTEPVMPSSESPLVLGAVNERQFRGLIGPLAIYASKKVSKDLRKALSEVVKTPTTPATEATGDSLVAWIPDSTALGTEAGKAPEGTQFISSSSAAQKSGLQGEIAASSHADKTRAQMQSHSMTSKTAPAKAVPTKRSSAKEAPVR